MAGRAKEVKKSWVGRRLRGMKLKVCKCGFRTKLSWKWKKHEVGVNLCPNLEGKRAKEAAGGTKI
jgi:hypothetical protein